jgi:hypothetical protein
MNEPCLRSFVPNCRPNLVGQFRRHFVHLVSRAGMLGSLLEYILFGLAASHEITVSHHVIATRLSIRAKPGSRPNQDL